MNVTVKSCADCPAKYLVREQGWSGYNCSLQKGYADLDEYIRKKKFHPGCPLEDIENSK